MIFSGRLSHTTNASTTDIINHINKRLLNDSTVIVTLNKGTENETDTGLIAERLMTPNCFDHGDLGVPSPPATSMMLSVSEIALWTAIGLLFCTILAIIILSIAVYQLKQKLYKTRLHSRCVIYDNHKMMFIYIQQDSLSYPHRYATIGNKVQEKLVYLMPV